MSKLLSLRTVVSGDKLRCEILARSLLYLRAQVWDLVQVALALYADLKFLEQ